MKRIVEYTNEELLALTDDDIKVVIAVEAMVMGIEHPGARPVEPVAPMLERGVPMYEVGDTGMLFEKQEEALEVAGRRVFKSEYSYECGYDYKYAKLWEPSVKRVMYYSEVDVIRNADELKKFKKAKDAHDKAVQEFKQRSEKLDKIRQDLFQRISVARDEVTRVENLKQAFTQYLRLADNDVETAKKFFANTYGSEALEVVKG